MRTFLAVILILTALLLACVTETTPQPPQDDDDTVPQAVAASEPTAADRPAAATFTATLGKEYVYELYTHCGVGSAVFDRGRWWRANPPLDDGRGNPPAGWGNPFTKGVMVLVQEDRAVFTSQSGRVVEFVPWPRGLNKKLCY